MSAPEFLVVLDATSVFEEYQFPEKTVQKKMSFQSTMKNSVSIVALENYFEENTVVLLEWETNLISE